MEDLEKRAIEDLPVVSSVGFHAGDKTHKAGVYANLRCCAASPYRGCGAKQVGPIRKSSERPTNADCFRELGRVIQRDHGPTFIAAAQELQAAEKDAADASTKRPADEAAASLTANDVLMLHRRFKMIQQRAAEANKTVLEAEKERDELHNQIEQIEEQLYPTRPRTDDDAGDAHEVLAEVENWDLRDHRQQATRVQNRRNVQLGSRQNQANLMVEGCTRTEQTFWTEDEFTVTASSGIRNRDVRVAEIVVREIEKAKPDKWGCVQARELWSSQEERQVRPGHFWLLKFGKVPGSNSCVEKKFLGNGDCALVVDV
jgi:hypothetical protein